MLFNNCADACSNGLYAAGFNGALDLENDSPISKIRFNDILQSNPGAVFFNPRLFDIFDTHKNTVPNVIIETGPLQRIE